MSSQNISGCRPLFNPEVVGVDASIDTLALTAGMWLWGGLKTTVEELTGNRIGIDKIKKDGEHIGHYITITCPTGRMIDKLIEWERQHKFTLSRVDIACDPCFGTIDDVRGFKAWLALHMWLKWPPHANYERFEFPEGTPVAIKLMGNDLASGFYLVDYASNYDEIADRNAVTARNVAAYYKPRPSIKVSRYDIPSPTDDSTNEVHAPLEDHALLEDQHRFRIELRLQKSRIVRANNISLQSLRTISPKELFDRNITIAEPRPRWVKRTPSYSVSCCIG